MAVCCFWLRSCGTSAPPFVAGGAHSCDYPSVPSRSNDSCITTRRLLRFRRRTGGALRISRTTRPRQAARALVEEIDRDGDRSEDCPLSQGAAHPVAIPLSSARAFPAHTPG